MKRLDYKVLTLVVFICTAFFLLPRRDAQYESQPDVIDFKGDLVSNAPDVGNATAIEDPPAGVNATETESKPEPEHEDPLKYFRYEADDGLEDINNGTLGFEKIFAIGFTVRSDKRDALALGASFHDLNIDWVEGVDADSIPEKAYPIGWNKFNHMDKPAEIGAWRAHMNVLRTIVEKKISSALIVEDDVDWDVSIRAQMKEFARGSRALQNTQETPFSPYGDDWQVLWPGHCAAKSREEERNQDRQFYVIPNDPTVRPESHRFEFWGPLLSDNPEMQSHRLVFVAEAESCSYAYAITYDGARKVLGAMSMMPFDQPMDLGLNSLCDERRDIKFTCIAPHPTIIGSWRQSGPASRDSDIISYDNGEWHDAFSNGVVYSTMLNIMPLINGSTTVKAQWDDVERQEVEIDDIEIPRGGLLYVPVPPPEMHPPEKPLEKTPLEQIEDMEIENLKIQIPDSLNSTDLERPADIDVP